MEAMMTGMINNIFFIIFPIIVYQMLATAGQRNFFVSHRVTMTVLFSISIVLCMLFPYQFLTDQYIFDLRQVPMIVGALYGGPIVSAMLFLVSSLWCSAFRLPPCCLICLQGPSSSVTHSTISLEFG